MRMQSASACWASSTSPPARTTSTATLVQAITPYTVRDRRALLERLSRRPPTRPFIERQEYALGTVCAAIPITAGDTAAAMAISLSTRSTDCFPRSNNYAMRSESS